MDPDSPPRELELSALEAEKEPMAPAAAAAAAEAEPETAAPPHPPSPQPAPQPPPAPPAAAGEKNGLALKIPPEEEEEEEAAAALGGSGGSGSPKFTGLGKEELLREASSPGWSRARRVLLLLFWAGWLGMLGAAAAIVVQAPKCRPLPERAWWELGALYRAPPRAFGGDLRGVEKRLGYLKEKLQVGGLVLGPVHPQDPQDPKMPTLKGLDSALGTPQDFSALVHTARDKGLKVILDLTPNPSASPVWGEAARGQLQAALEHWLSQGVAGIFLDGIEELQSWIVPLWRNLTEKHPSPKGVERVLIGGTRQEEPWKVPREFWEPPQLLLGPFLRPLGPQNPPLGPQNPSETPESSLRNLLSFINSSSPSLAWSLGSPWQSWVSSSQRLQQLLLVWGLPGTPVLSYGDELQLERPQSRLEPLPSMPWELIEATAKGENDTQPLPALELCRALASLRARERSLLYGDAQPVPAGAAIALLRQWDRGDGFLLLLNPLATPLRPFRGGRDPRLLPPSATRRLSTQPELRGREEEEEEVQLEELQLGPFEGMLLSFPYSGP